MKYELKLTVTASVCECHCCENVHLHLLTALYKKTIFHCFQTLSLPDGDTKLLEYLICSHVCISGYVTAAIPPTH